MGHKSWGGARPNKWDIYQHEEPQGERFYVQLDVDLHYVVIDGESNKVVFSDEDKLTCECEAEHLNSLEQA
ncbi:MAG TPA: hypothetical protein VLF16_06995 [Pseudomonas sp.]|nr:hypothetical protein [Pseudomonas sp.]